MNLFLNKFYLHSGQTDLSKSRDLSSLLLHTNKFYLLILIAGLGKNAGNTDSLSFSLAWVKDKAAD